MAKEAVSHNSPCVICGKPDYCFVIVHDDGTRSHCCARVSESAVSSQYGMYELAWEKDSNIGHYYCYKSVEDREASRQRWREEHGLKPSSSKKKLKQPSAAIQNNAPVVKAVSEATLASWERIDVVLRNFLEILILEDFHRESLRKDWNTEATGDLLTKILQTFPVRSLPPADYVRKGRMYDNRYANKTRREIVRILVSKVGDLMGVPGFFINKYGDWDFAGKEGLLIPCFNEKGMITGLRIREDYPVIKGTYQGVEGRFTHSYGKEGEHVWVFTDENTKEEFPYTGGKPKGKAQSKYKAFSTAGYNMGCGSGTHMSIYTHKGDDFSQVYFTEGEKKAMVANMLLGHPVVSFPGVGTFNLLFDKGGKDESLAEYLKGRGLRQAVIAYDADKNENVLVLRAEASAVQAFISNGISIAIGEWNANWGKGLDDTLVQGLRPSIYLVQ